MLLPPQRLLAPEDTGPQFGAGRDAPKVIAITSPRPRDGKTVTTANLAACFAEAGRRVLVVDVDFRNPELPRYLGSPDGPGLSDVLAADPDLRVDLETVVAPTTVPGVTFVGVGGKVAHTYSFASRIPAVLAAARELADVVLLDTGPVLISTEALDLMPSVDTVLLIGRVGRTTREQAARATETLARLRVPVTGVALVGTSRLTTRLAGQVSSGSFGFGRSRNRRGSTPSSRHDQEQRA
jgi:Mrp family chromosome partitioning ATPase